MERFFPKNFLKMFLYIAKHCLIWLSCEVQYHHSIPVTPKVRVENHNRTLEDSVQCSGVCTATSKHANNNALNLNTIKSRRQHE